MLFFRNAKPKRNAEMIRRHIVFYGRVQGVGFRWRAQQAAKLCDCTGWCRNDPEGTVTMEIQGSGEAVDQVVRSLESGKYIWIEHMDVTPLCPDPEERGFSTD